MNIKYIHTFCLSLLFGVVSITGALAQQQESKPIKIVPKKDKDSLVNVAFQTIEKKDVLGGVSTVNVAELMNKSYGTYSLDNLQSFVGGFTGNIWGQSPLILVNGVPRRASDVRMTEVESISVLKAASAVALYGSQAARGVILITTKRGNGGDDMKIDVRANSGIFVPKGYPNYLPGADYMTLYNEALTNDGITTGKYTQGRIDSTRTGINPFLYPDIDFYSSDFVRKVAYRSDITTEISGGNNFARYYTNVGLSYNNSLVKYGEQKNNNDFNFSVRGNVDMNIAKWLTASADAVAIANKNYVGRGNFWGSASTVDFYLNKYSPLIPIDKLDPNNASLQTVVKNSNHIIDGKYLLGGVSTNPTNAFSDMLAAGYIRTKNSTFLYNLNLKADLGSILEGLVFKTGASMDYTSVYSEGYSLGYATYQPKWSAGNDMIVGLTKFNEDKNSTTEFVGRSTYTQTTSAMAQFAYNRTFANDHNVSANLLGWWYKSQFSSDIDNDGGSVYQPTLNTNLGFQAAYNFRSKYYLDFTAGLVHSVKLAPGHRNSLSPAVTVGWRISNESFFKNNVSFVDDLKLSGSYSSIVQDMDLTGGTRAGYYLYQGFYSNTGTLSGWLNWRDGSAGGPTSLSGQASNYDLTFVKRNEFRVSLDGSILKNLISFDMNYFSQVTDGLLSRGVTIYPSYFQGSGDFRPWINFNKDKRTGFDFSVNLNNKLGEVSYSLGVAGMYYDSKALRRDETIDTTAPYLARQGRALDANYAYIAEGLFQNQAEIDAHARQTFGTVKPGDIKYKDINNDGIIDYRDAQDLGKAGWSASPFNYGVNLTLKYKKFTLFALGSGSAGAIGFKNSSYYWLRSNTRYSDLAWGRWTEATASTATMPRLTTNSSNNFQNSTYWMYKTSRFDLNRVQLSYDFGKELFKNSFVAGLNVYVQGDNLLVISGERKLMETNINAAPQTRFFNLGAKASF
ncbi:SusC/RagA family TonB-linked outer membrane protein [Pedobacter sp.]|uniref:SusC/RagA family TonB-linked outer membrane protein n=1 Tax=Pedobacter sp. TaxID=1411316 RepID=UPI0031D5CA96